MQTDTWFKVGVIATIIGVIISGISMLVGLAVWYGWKPPIFTGPTVPELARLPIVMGAAGAALLAFTWLALYLSFRATRGSIGDSSPRSSQTIPSAPIPPPSRQKRVFVDATTEDLTSRFKGHTSFEADTLLKPFIGKWMRVSGPLSDVSGYEWGLSVIIDQKRLEKSVQPLFVNAIFDSQSLDRISTITPKTPIHVVGQIALINSYSVRLNHCELVD